MSVLVGVIRDVVSFLGVWGGVRNRSVSDFGGVVVLSEGEVGGGGQCPLGWTFVWLVGIWGYIF